MERFERGMLCRRYSVGGWEIGIVRYLSDHPAKLDVISRAISLVESTSVTHARWVRSYVRRFLVLDVNYASHRRGSLTCVLSAKVMQKGDAAVVASKIVHEATHARFTGFRYVARSPEFTRMENRCIEEQAEFLRTLHRSGWENASEWATFYEKGLKPVPRGKRTGD